MWTFGNYFCPFIQYVVIWIVRISNFSAKHNIHRLVSGVYGFSLRIILQVILGTPSFSLILYVSVDRAVLSVSFKVEG